MKSFQFKDLLLLSPKAKRARKIELHPGKNLILGRNHTGKSTVIKNLFLILGARPSGKLSNWDDDAIGAVSFVVEDRSFIALHERGHRALFSSTGQLLDAASNHKDWSAIFARYIGFNLPLTDRSSEAIIADPRCFFLPFYINQDGSWQKNWETFAGMQQYKAPFGPILDYFSGVRPPEYYELEARRVQRQHELVEFEREAVFLQRARERFAKSTALAGPKLNPENFIQEISRLTNQVTELNEQQEKIRMQAVREAELISNIKLQIRLSEETLGVYQKDSVYLRDDKSELLACPTCGAEHSKSFLDVLTYAEDARILRSIVSELNRDLVEAELRHSDLEKRLAALRIKYQEVSAILDVRRGELRFRDVVDSLGAESAFSAFDREANAIEEEIGQKSRELTVLKEQIQKILNPRRANDIMSAFRQSYMSALRALNLPELNPSKLRLTSRPDLSGSGGPRSVLAYYAALWAVSYGEFGAYRIPIVIDAPQQQGQDDLHFPKILSFISNNLPEGAQVILGVEMDPLDSYDNVIELTEPYNLLRADEYEFIDTLLEPFVLEMYACLFGR